MNNRDRAYQLIVRKPFGTPSNSYRRDDIFKAVVRPLVKDLKEYFAVLPEGETEYTVIPCVNIKFTEEEIEVNDV
jgi:hypothetical protein